MLIHPQFDPVAFQIGFLAIRWYGLMYLIGFLGGMIICRWRLTLSHVDKQGWLSKDIDDLISYVVFGAIVGGRLGYIVFYKAHWYILHPLDTLSIWKGGMSFHGGFLGVVLGMLVFAHKRGFQLLQVADFVAPAVPFGLAAGRLGNFINGELWGRVCYFPIPWAMGFPSATIDDREWIIMHLEETAHNGLLEMYQINHGMLPRHPSQIYEMILEGILLGAFLFKYAGKERPIGAVASFFLIGYGLSRFLVEFFREPDSYLGLLAFQLSLGQWLSLPMIIVGILLRICFYTNSRSKRRI